MNKKIIRIIATLLAVILLASILLGVISSVPAGAKPMEEGLVDLKEKGNQLELKQQDTKNLISSLEYEHMATLEKKQLLDDQIILTQQEIKNAEEQINAYDLLITDKEQEVVSAQEAEDRQLEQFRIHVRAMEETSTASYLAVLFEARSFSDFIGRLDFIKQIMSEDERQHQLLIDAKETTQNAVSELQIAKDEQEDEFIRLGEKKDELQDQVVMAQNMLSEIEDSIEDYQALLAEEEAQRLEIEALIEEMTNEIERQKSLANGTGSFLWPSPSSSIVTSQFGTRYHPVYETYTTHYGVDIGAPYGSEVIASDSGTVVTATYNSSYGYYVVINHGNGYSTLYAHMSELIVYAGQNVAQGEIIGYSGSTGVSTGPHLHFEVRTGATCINPLDFFGGYTIQD